MYLDNAATTPLKPEVKKAIIDYLDIFGNPSSHHSVGDQARFKLFECRHTIAKFINAEDDEIIFTSGGSASNCLAICGWENSFGGQIFYSPIAHKSILKCCQDNFGMDGQVRSLNSRALKVDAWGYIDLADIEEHVENSSYSLVVVDYANSEIGTIQNIIAIVDICHRHGAHVYLDCTGSIAQIPVDVKKLGADMIGFSGHKLGALKGCGVLWKRKDLKIAPLIYGAQEQGLFGGTENMLGIVALAAALKNYEYRHIDTATFIETLLNTIPGSHILGAKSNRLPNTISVAFDNVCGTKLATMCDLGGYQVSNGSACNSGDPTPSPTLVAIKVPEDLLYNNIRISFSGTETADDLIRFISDLSWYVERVRSEQ